MNTVIEQAAHQCGIQHGLDSLATQFVQAVADRIEAMPETSRAQALRDVVAALEDDGPNRFQRVIDALFTEGVQA